MGHFFKTQPNPKFLDPTQPTKVFTRPNPTHHRHLVWHIRLYRKLYTTTVTHHRQVHSSQLEWKSEESRTYPIFSLLTLHSTSQLSMKVIIQLQYSLADSRVAYFMTLEISHSQVSTQPNPTHQNLKKNSDPTQPNPTHGWTQPMTNSAST